MNQVSTFHKYYCTMNEVTGGHQVQTVCTEMHLRLIIVPINHNYINGKILIFSHDSAVAAMSSHTLLHSSPLARLQGSNKATMKMFLWNLFCPRCQSDNHKSLIWLSCANSKIERSNDKCLIHTLSRAFFYSLGQQ